MKDLVVDVNISGVNAKSTHKLEVIVKYKIS